MSRLKKIRNIFSKWKTVQLITYCVCNTYIYLSNNSLIYQYWRTWRTNGISNRKRKMYKIPFRLLSIYHHERCIQNKVSVSFYCNQIFIAYQSQGHSQWQVRLQHWQSMPLLYEQKSECETTAFLISLNTQLKLACAL